MVSSEASRAKVSEAPNQNRDRLLAAALDEFLEQGFQAARVEDIARRAGVGKGSVYLHFRNKEELFGEVIEAGVLTRLKEAEAFAQSFSGSATELLSQMLHNNLVDFWGSSSSGIYKLVIAESGRFPELAANYYRITRRARALIESTLRLGIEQGEYRDIDATYAARIILDALDNELVQAHAFAAHAEAEFDAHRYIDTLLELMLRGAAREADA